MTRQPDPPREAALAFAARGWPVFPCRERGEKAKAPYLPGESSPGAKDGGHWLASVDPCVIAGWWARWPGALIGLPTGVRSGTVVVDLDPKDHDPIDMMKALSAWCGGLKRADPETGEVLRPAVSRTRSGGFHLWFAFPPLSIRARVATARAARGLSGGDEIGNRSGLFRREVKAGACPPTLAHIDVRAEGGYVIAPPSVLADGAGAYEWIFEAETLPPLPSPLLRQIAGLGGPEPVAPPQRSVSRSHGSPTPGAEHPGVRAYAEKMLDGVADELARASKGQRGTAAFAAASSAGRLAVLRVMGEGKILARLEAACVANGLVRDDGARAVRRELENGLAAAGENVNLARLAATLDDIRHKRSGA
jgi:hypothetical protein